MGLVDKAKALVPWGESEKDRLREDLESWKEQAQEFQQRYLDLRDKHDELQTKYHEEKQELQDDLRRVERERDEAQEKVKELKERIDESITEDLESDESRDELTNREKQLYKVVRNNANTIESQSDVLDLMQQKHGVEWKQSTLKVNLSRVKSKGHGDLRKHWKD